MCSFRVSASVALFLSSLLSLSDIQAQTGYMLSASPTTIFPCGRLTVAWTAPQGHSSQDWVSLARVTDPAESSYSWQRTNTDTSGTLVFAAAYPAGSYDFRLLRGGGYTVLARSAPITVQGGGCFTLCAFPPNVSPAGTIMLVWAALGNRASNDWIGLFPLSGGGSPLWQQTVGTGAPSGIFAVPAPITPGQYVFRYWSAHYGNRFIVTSNTLHVGSAPAVIIVEGRVRIRTKPGSPELPVVGATVRITRNNGLVIQGTTDLTGNYAFTLPTGYGPGQYTIRAILIFPDFDAVNYRYSQLDQTPEPNRNPDDDLIPLTNGVNCGMDIYVPQPVVLVHGILGSTETWGEAETLLRLDPKLKSRTPRGQQPPGWRPEWTWPGSIAHRGYIAKSVSYGPPPLHIWNSHVRNAELLNIEIAAFRRDVIAQFMDSTAPIDIVAHSMGGLVTRAFLHAHAQDGSVDRILTFATPHAGVARFYQCSTVPGCYYFYISPSNCPNWGPPLPFVPLAFEQMDPRYMLETFNPSVTRTRGARFILVGSATDWTPCEPEAWLGPLFPWDDEWVPTLSSVFYPLYFMPNLPVLAYHFTPDKHEQIHSNVEPQFTLNQVLLEDLERIR